MKGLKMLIGALFVLLVGCNNLKPHIDYGFETDATRRKKIDAYFTNLVELEQFNGVLLVQPKGRKPFLKAYNINNNESASSFVETQSQFDIHSVSKLIAKAIILEMEIKGKIRRTDFLNKYISDFPNGDKITIQHLMDNTSGLPREPNLEDTTKFALSNDEIIEWAKKEKLQFEPGSEKRYSNVGYELLYYIIGQLNNTSFSDYVASRYFPKLKMTKSSGHFYTSKANLTHWAKNHQKDGGLIVVDNITDYIYRQSMLYATAQDLLLFLGYLENEPYRSTLQNDEGIIAWTGGAEGVRAHVQYNTKQEYSFVVLANYDDIPLKDILQTVENIMEDKPFKMPKKIERVAVVVEDAVLKKYVGTYEFSEADNLLLEFKLENNALHVYQEGSLLTPLMAENDSIFFYDPSANESVQFIEGAEGYEVLFGWKGIPLKGVRK